MNGYENPVVPEVVEDVVEGHHVLGGGPAARLRRAARRGLVRERDRGVVVVECLEVVDPLLQVRVVRMAGVVRVAVADLLAADHVPRVDVEVDEPPVVLRRLGGRDRVVPSRERRVDALRLERPAHRLLEGIRVQGRVADAQAPQGIRAGRGRRDVVPAAGRLGGLGPVAGRAGQGDRGERSDERGRDRDRDDQEERAPASDRTPTRAESGTVIPAVNGMRDHQLTTHRIERT